MLIYDAKYGVALLVIIVYRAYSYSWYSEVSAILKKIAILANGDYYFIITTTI